MERRLPEREVVEAGQVEPQSEDRATLAQGWGAYSFKNSLYWVD
jgi:hypothetical protein